VGFGFWAFLVEERPFMAAQDKEILMKRASARQALKGRLIGASDAALKGRSSTASLTGKTS